MNPEESVQPAERPQPKRLHWPTTPTGMSAVGFSQVGLFVIVLFYVLHEMKGVLLPLVLAVLGGGLMLVLGFALAGALPLLRARPAQALRAL